MKVLVLKTGEVYKSLPNQSILVESCDKYGSPLSFQLEEVNLINEIPKCALILKSVDWEQRRYEMIKDFTAALLSHEGYNDNTLSMATMLSEKIEERLKK